MVQFHVLLISVVLLMTAGCGRTAYIYKEKALQAGLGGNHSAAADLFLRAAEMAKAEQETTAKSLSDDPGSLYCMAAEELLSSNQWKTAEHRAHQGLKLLSNAVKTPSLPTEVFRCRLVLAILSSRGGDFSVAESLAKDYTSSSAFLSVTAPANRLSALLYSGNRHLAIDVRSAHILRSSQVTDYDENALRGLRDELLAVANEYSSIGNSQVASQFIRRSKALEIAEINEKSELKVARGIGRQYKILGFPERADYFLGRDRAARKARAQYWVNYTDHEPASIKAIALPLCLAALYFAESDSPEDSDLALHRLKDLVNGQHSQIENRVLFICKMANASLRAKEGNWADVEALGREFLGYSNSVTGVTDEGNINGLDYTEPLAWKLESLLWSSNVPLAADVRMHYLMTRATVSRKVDDSRFSKAAEQYALLEAHPQAERFKSIALLHSRKKDATLGNLTFPFVATDQIKRYQASGLSAEANILEELLIWPEASDSCAEAIRSATADGKETAITIAKYGLEILGTATTMPADARSQNTFACRTALALGAAQTGNWTQAEELAEEYLEYIPPVADYQLEGVGFLAINLSTALFDHDNRLSSEVRIHFYGFLTANIDSLLKLYETSAQSFADANQYRAASRLRRMADFIREIEGEIPLRTNPEVSLKEKADRYRSVGFSQRAIALERLEAVESVKLANRDRMMLRMQQDFFREQRRAETEAAAARRAAAQEKAMDEARRMKQPAFRHEEQCRDQCSNQALSCTVSCYGDIKRFDQCNLPCLTNRINCESNCTARKSAEIERIEAKRPDIPRQDGCDNSFESSQTEMMMTQVKNDTIEMSADGARCYTARNFLRIAELQFQVATRCSREIKESEANLSRMRAQEASSCKSVEK